MREINYIIGTLRETFKDPKFQIPFLIICFFGVVAVSSGILEDPPRAVERLWQN